MPHLTIEYSGNLESLVDIDGVVENLHEAACATGVFPIGGVRTRAVRRDVYRIADGNPGNVFVHVTARIGAGRDKETKTRVSDALFEVVCTALADVYNSSPLAISFELQETQPDYSRKKNNIHALLAQRSN